MRGQCGCLTSDFFCAGVDNCIVSWLETADVIAVVLWVTFVALLLPQLSSFASTLIKIYLTVTIVRFSVWATTWTVHVVSGLPASTIAITVTKLHIACVSFLTSGISLDLWIIPVSPWHWAIVISRTGIRVFSVWIISGRRSIVPWIPGVIITTGVAMGISSKFKKKNATSKSWS